MVPGRHHHHHHVLLPKWQIQRSTATTGSGPPPPPPPPRWIWPAAPPLSPLAATACARLPHRTKTNSCAWPDRWCPHLMLSSSHGSAGSATGSTRRSRLIKQHGTGRAVGTRGTVAPCMPELEPCTESRRPRSPLSKPMPRCACGVWCLCAVQKTESVLYVYINKCHNACVRACTHPRFCELAMRWPASDEVMVEWVRLKNKAMGGHIKKSS